MKKITNTAELREAICLLEIKHSDETVKLKEQLQTTIAGLNPLRMAKNTIREIISGPDFKTNVTGSLLGMSAGSIAKKVLIGSTLNPLKFLSGNLLQMIVAGIFTKNAAEIKSSALRFIKKIIRKKDTIS